MSLPYNPRAKLCIENAKQICTELGGTAVQPIDIFLSTLVARYEPIILFLTECTSDPAALIQETYQLANKLKRVKKTRVSWTRESSKIIKSAAKEAGIDGTPYIGLEHIFLSSIGESAQVSDFLAGLGVDAKSFQKSFRGFLEAYHKSEGNRAPHGNSKTSSMMDKYCSHINTRVHKNGFKFFGRQEEINNLMTILCRKQKSNILLVGEAGVGKTALVEGLAQAMDNPPEDSDIGFVPMDIFELSLPDMLSGAIYRGEFENRLTKTIGEIVERPARTVIFIDEIHMMVGAGDKEGSMDAANILKPALADGTISCIGATTFAEYKKYLEKDAALTRRFEVVHVKEPTPEETYNILANCKGSYEDYHQVEFSDGAIKALVDAADIHMSYRRFPDKAFDLLDEAGTFFKLKSSKRPPELTALERDLRDFMNDEESDESRFPEYEKKMEKFRAGMDEWHKEMTKEKLVIDKKQADIFLKYKFKFESQKVNLKAYLHTKIVGHKEAIDSFCSSIQFLSKRRRKGRPLVSLLLAGPKGVGKKTLIEEFAELQPLKKEGLIVFDMSEYSDPMSLTKLIGSSAGYVGYDKGGVFTERIKNNPNALIVFDNIDHAHPSVVDLIAKSVEQGYIHDSIGQRINCSRCMFFFVSDAVKEDSSIGFGVSSVGSASLDRRKLPASLINSIDKAIIFSPLPTQDLITIASRHMSESLPSVKLNVDSKVYDHLVEKAGAKNGARALLSSLDSDLICPIYEKIDNRKKNPSIFAKMLDNQIDISTVSFDEK